MAHGVHERDRNEAGVMALSKRPANNLSAAQVNDCSQVVKSALEPQICKVLGPNVVRVAGYKPRYYHL